MFYLKQECDGITVDAVITDENVFCICPECSREHSVDLSEIFKAGNADFYSTRVYCEKCSAKRTKK